MSAGQYKGRELSYPRAGLRPTKAVTRQAVFNIVGERVVGARVLDLFAGGGSLGIEALSRGAASAVFVEESSPVLRCLRDNAAGLRGASVVRGDVLKVMPRLARDGFDLVLADPPYRKALVQATLDAAAGCGILAADGWFVIEHSAKEAPVAPAGWEQLKQRHYGESTLTVFRRQS